MVEKHADVVSIEDREFVREGLAWLAEWIRSRYPKLNFGDIPPAHSGNGSSKRLGGSSFGS
jgi:hypothetical protein